MKRQVEQSVAGSTRLCWDVRCMLACNGVSRRFGFDVRLFEDSCGCEVAKEGSSDAGGCLVLTQPIDPAGLSIKLNIK